MRSSIPLRDQSNSFYRRGYALPVREESCVDLRTKERSVKCLTVEAVGSFQLGKFYHVFV